MGSKHKSLDDVLLLGLRELHQAEKHLGKALPKLAKSAEAKGLGSALDAMRDDSQRRLERLDGIFEALDKKPHSEPCAAMEGLIVDARTAADTFEGSELADVVLVAAVRTITQYAVARYQVLRAWAEQSGNDKVSAPLEILVEEFKAAEGRLAPFAAAKLGDSAASARPFNLKAAALLGLH